MAAQRVDTEKLRQLREAISSDAGELRERLRRTRHTLLRSADDVGSAGREVWQILGLMLRRRLRE
jgi:hypothetical protein